MRTTILCFVGMMAWVGGLPMAAHAEETIENDVYKHWAQFKPGSFCKLKSVSKVMGQTTVSTMTTTLKMVTKEKVVLMVTSASQSAGQEFKMPSQKIEHLARIPKPKPENIEKQKGKVSDAKAKEGKEELSVKGKKIKTKWNESTFKMGKMTTKSKTWMSDEIPGQIVKSVSTTEGEMKMVTEMTLVDYKAIKK